MLLRLVPARFEALLAERGIVPVPVPGFDDASPARDHWSASMVAVA
jgi:hypothetical protein